MTQPFDPPVGQPTTPVAGVTPPVGHVPAQPDSTSTKDVAKDEAAGVAADAKEGARHVADTAKSEARQVADEARYQSRQMFGQLRAEATDQVGAQQSRLADTLRTLGQELDGISRGEQTQHGLATDLARQASSRLDSAASWLGNREPAQVLDEVKRYARRNPGTFLVFAGLAGLVAGRLTRSLTDDARSDDNGRAPFADGRGYEAGYQGGYVGQYRPAEPAGPGTVGRASYEGTDDRSPVPVADPNAPFEDSGAIGKGPGYIAPDQPGTRAGQVSQGQDYVAPDEAKRREDIR
ncbi:MAG: hypothetical protein Q4G51_02130 [Dermatophilus congolensis]|nr:hypothetical protein [Dermatophilus congolensis]